MKAEEKESKEKYELIAEHYHRFRTETHPEGWFFNELLEMPATLEVIGNIKGKKVLDFGCGSGIYLKILKKQCAEIKGFDISNNMLKIARADNPELDLRKGSAYKIPFDEKFDIVFASLVVSYLNDWNRMFKQIKKVLKKGGYFIFSIKNPVIEVTTKTNNRFAREFKNYFNEKKGYISWENVLTGYSSKEKGMPFYHKKYETMIKTIVKNSFEIVDYKDAYPDKKAKKLFPEYYSRFTKIPYFCVWKVKKK